MTPEERKAIAMCQPGESATCQRFVTCPTCSGSGKVADDLRARGPNVVVCRVIDVASNFAELAGLPEKEDSDA